MNVAQILVVYSMNSRPGLLVDEDILVGVTDPHGHADVLGSIHKEVVDNHVEHVIVAASQVLLALLNMVLTQAGAVAGFQVFLELQHMKTSRHLKDSLKMAYSKDILKTA